MALESASFDRTSDLRLAPTIRTRLIAVGYAMLLGCIVDGD